MNLADRIRASEKTRKAVEEPLKTDEKVLARITDGIYRQPSSALRELISNAYDADATEVIIQTDAPRFSQISVRDNGLGLSPDVLEHLVHHIGGSPKRTETGADLGVTARLDDTQSPGGRQLIGKLGIGLFSVAQFTRHFLIITKTSGDRFRTVADITLGSVAGQQRPSKEGARDFQTGHARIWRERAVDVESHGTEIKLLDLLPRTKAELASEDLWTKIDYDKKDPDPDLIKSQPPIWHIGRMKPRQDEVLETQPALPWEEGDEPRERFNKLTAAVRRAAESDEIVDLDLLFDHYLQTMWTLALAAPLAYVEGHPFDYTADDGFVFFELDNRPRGQAQQLSPTKSESPRKALSLKTPNGTVKQAFNVFIDGVQLFRPILFRDLPKSKAAVKSPLLFLGKHIEHFDKKRIELSGGPLEFEAYLFWNSKIVPKQHQGVMLRVGNASGTLFDRTFMGYQVAEQQRIRQITAEIFVRTGLDDAINLDRESFNYAHPHYQYLVKWLHSALRQLSNRHKELGKVIRSRKVAAAGERVRERVEEHVEAALRERGVEDVPEVQLVDPLRAPQLRDLRKQGTIALRKSVVLPAVTGRQTAQQIESQKLLEQKAIGIVQLLHGWGLLEQLSYDEQEKLVRDIIQVLAD